MKLTQQSYDRDIVFLAAEYIEKPMLDAAARHLHNYIQQKRPGLASLSGMESVLTDFLSARDISLLGGIGVNVHRVCIFECLGPSIHPV